MRELWFGPRSALPEHARSRRASFAVSREAELILAAQRGVGNAVVARALTPARSRLVQREDGKDVDAVAVKARDMAAAKRLHHHPLTRQILKASEDNESMNCLDAVLYVAEQAGVLKRSFAEAMYAELADVLAEFEDGRERMEYREAEADERELNAQKAALEAAIRGTYSVWSRLVCGNASRRGQLEADLADLKEQLTAARERLANARMADQAVRDRATAAHFSRYLRLDDARTYVYARGHDAEMEYQGATPQKGWTVTMTQDESRTPGVDHVLLSLGEGRAVHLNTAVADQLAHLDFSPGHLNEIDLNDYIETYARGAAGIRFTWYAAPPVWQGELAEGHRQA